MTGKEASKQPAAKVASQSGVTAFAAVFTRVKEDYVSAVKSNKKLVSVDALIAYCVATGLIQFLFVMFVGTFPFNSFLSGLLCHIGLFSLAGEVPLCFLFFLMLFLQQVHQSLTRAHLNYNSNNS